MVAPVGCGLPELGGGRFVSSAASKRRRLDDAQVAKLDGAAGGAAVDAVRRVAGRVRAEGPGHNIVALSLGYQSKTQAQKSRGNGRCGLQVQHGPLARRRRRERKLPRHKPASVLGLVLPEAGVPSVAVGGLVGEAGVEGEVRALVEELRVCSGTPGESLEAAPGALSGRAVSGRMGWGGV